MNSADIIHKRRPRMARINAMDRCEGTGCKRPGEGQGMDDRKVKNLCGRCMQSP